MVHPLLAPLWGFRILGRVLCSFGHAGLPLDEEKLLSESMVDSLVSKAHRPYPVFEPLIERSEARGVWGASPP